MAPLAHSSHDHPTYERSRYSGLLPNARRMPYHSAINRI